MGLDRVKRVYERLGEDDPLWAVLTEDSRRGGGWDPEEFFATGREEIAGVFDELERLDALPKAGAALDFGCGVGRLSQALAERFQSVVGLDISSTMVRAAERYNEHGERCRYLVNETERLAEIPDASQDFVYSAIALQHSPPASQVAYLGELLRVLKPGGIGAVQLRIGPDRRPGGLMELSDAIFFGWMKPTWKRLRGRPPVQVHRVGEKAARAAIEAGGGRVLAATPTDEDRRKSRRSLRFTFRKG